MCKMQHPDRTTGNCEKFKVLKNAYTILINPIKRNIYDTVGTVDESTDVYIVSDAVLEKCRANYAGS